VTSAWCGRRGYNCRSRVAFGPYYKEQKVSEFRQAWIDDLRKCLVAYLVNINAISDALRLQKAGPQIDNSTLITSYKSLNEASHGIILRINAEEAAAKPLLKSMSDFEALAKTNVNLNPDQIRAIELRFIDASRNLLKFEWKRVKRGESTFIWTNQVVACSIAVMVALLAYLWATRDRDSNGKSPHLQPIVLCVL
jgi:hypothetical protein